ncbi:hypothetical protein GE115_10835 [Agromyces sp. CFH 90414]|uniref:Uncharacterized protein n=1 Tax=Agromyces agglutinans TaxID=2662258 RepID=A0A6I2FCY2_9MICO|nr:hypothetical protein [Agromyces agglutinans]MRG60356.1 hypothetical protein [Agromyces agglutinans]
MSDQRDADDVRDEWARDEQADRDQDGRDGDRPSGEDIHLPEEKEVDGETVVADTASGGAPDPA